MQLQTIIQACMDFFCHQLFKHTVLNIFKQAAGPPSPADLQRLYCESLMIVVVLIKK